MVIEIFVTFFLYMYLTRCKSVVILIIHPYVCISRAVIPLTFTIMLWHRGSIILILQVKKARLRCSEIYITNKWQDWTSNSHDHLSPGLPHAAAEHHYKENSFQGSQKWPFFTSQQHLVLLPTPAFSKPSALFILGNCSLLICLLPHRLPRSFPRCPLRWASVPFSWLPPSVSNLIHFYSFVYSFNKCLLGISCVPRPGLGTCDSTVDNSDLPAQTEFVLLGGYREDR